jgi:hypothetical protein
MADCVKECCEQFCTNVTAEGYALTNSGNIVTSTASALACSEISYEDAWFQALSSAQQTAYIEAKNSANIIDQTLEIVNSRSLIPSKPGLTLGSRENPFSELHATDGFFSTHSITLADQSGSYAIEGMDTLMLALILQLVDI